MTLKGILLYIYFMSWFKDNFHTNKAQRIGLMVLISLIFLLTIVNFTIDYFIPPVNKYNYVLDTVTFVDIEIPKKFKKPTSKKYFKKGVKTKKIPVTKAKPANKKRTYVQKIRFTFDPNKTTRDSLILLGLKPYVADNIIKYRNKGGHFYRAADLEKIYGIDKKLAKDLQSYVSIPKKTFTKYQKDHSKDTVKKEITKIVNTSLGKKSKGLVSKNETKIPKFDKIINLNKASKEDLVEVPGIGKYYADHIIKLRDEVGGLHSVDQLLSIYSLSKQRLEKFKQYLSVDDSFTKININTADQKTLANHKYIDWKTAKIIVNYRKNHGRYKNVDDLKKIKIIDVNWLEKVQPYLSY